jgi:hypothetical protein
MGKARRQPRIRTGSIAQAVVGVRAPRVAPTGFENSHGEIGDSPYTRRPATLRVEGLIGRGPRLT